MSPSYFQVGVGGWTGPAAVPWFGAVLVTSQGPGPELGWSGCSGLDQPESDHTVVNYEFCSVIGCGFSHVMYVGFGL